ncbi:hypothetical protein CCH79_00019037 [Gambusia affinis]|uniref:Uncharacterized protein n=1 Tax=Gambusia affinis TaxID=33528 RepID=A0A315VYB7_GAMAF|nr:hypothetical protein CCH79_00019037 [Gambusia affinis]
MVAHRFYLTGPIIGCFHRNVHCSQSHLRHHETARALLHNFSGNPAAALEAGFFLSFPPAVCRNQQVKRVTWTGHLDGLQRVTRCWCSDREIQRIPLDHICLETDSPARGLHRNVSRSPTFLRTDAETTVLFLPPRGTSRLTLPCPKVKGQAPETVRDITTQNAYRLFSRASR